MTNSFYDKTNKTIAEFTGKGILTINGACSEGKIRTDIIHELQHGLDYLQSTQTEPRGTQESVGSNKGISENTSQSVPVNYTFKPLQTTNTELLKEDLLHNKLKVYIQDEKGNLKEWKIPSDAIDEAAEILYRTHINEITAFSAEKNNDLKGELSAIAKALDSDKAWFWIKQEGGRINMYHTDPAEYKTSKEAGIPRALFGTAKKANTDFLQNSHLNIAKRMEFAGKTPKEIREKTGWEIMPDGKWQFKIDDSNMNLKVKLDQLKKLNPTDTPDLNKSIPLSDILSHDELEKYYPGLTKEIDVLPYYDKNDENGGAFQQNTNGKGIIYLNTGRDWNILKQSLIHELQHGLEQVEKTKGSELAGNKGMAPKYRFTINYWDGADREDILEGLKSGRIKLFTAPGYKENIDYSKMSIESIANLLYGINFGEIRARAAGDGTSIKEELALLSKYTQSPLVDLWINTKDDNSKITLKQVNHNHYFSTPSGEIYGFYHKGKVYIDPDHLTPETTFEELSHLQQDVIRTAAKNGDSKAASILDAFKKVTVKLVDAAIAGKTEEVLKNTKGVVDLSSPHYRQQTGESGNDYRERIEDEVWAKLQAKSAIDKFERANKKTSLIRQLIDWIHSIKKYFASKPGLENSDDLDKLTLNKLVDRSSNSLLKGEYLNNKGVQLIAVSDSLLYRHYADDLETKHKNYLAEHPELKNKPSGMFLVYADMQGKAIKFNQKGEVDPNGKIAYTVAPKITDHSIDEPSKKALLEKENRRYEATEIKMGTQFISEMQTLLKALLDARNYLQQKEDKIPLQILGIKPGKVTFGTNFKTITPDTNLQFGDKTKAKEGLAGKAVLYAKTPDGDLPVYGPDLSTKPGMVNDLVEILTHPEWMKDFTRNDKGDREDPKGYWNTLKYVKNYLFVSADPENRPEDKPNDWVRLYIKKENTGLTAWIYDKSGKKEITLNKDISPENKELLRNAIASQRLFANKAAFLSDMQNFPVHTVKDGILQKNYIPYKQFMIEQGFGTKEIINSGPMNPYVMFSKPEVPAIPQEKSYVPPIEKVKEPAMDEPLDFIESGISSDAFDFDAFDKANEPKQQSLYFSGSEESKGKAVDAVDKPFVPKTDYLDDDWGNDSEDTDAAPLPKGDAKDDTLENTCK